MDQIIKLLLTCIGMIMLTACGTAQTDSKQPETTQTTIQQESETVSDKNRADDDKKAPDTEKNKDESADNTESRSKTLVIYFSRTGNTEKIAEYLIELTGADSYVINAAEPYTDEDIEYNNSSCRANREQNDSSVRPGIADPIESIDDYDTIFLGYPIWWGQEPRIIDTFLESYDFSDKTVITFCTSGSSGIATSEKNIAELVPIGDQLEGRRFPAGATKDEVKEWYDTLDLNI